MAAPVFGAASRLPAGVAAARASGLVPPVTGRLATARNLGKQMVTQTAKAPGATAAAELGAAVGGGWGAVMAEEVSPATKTFVFGSRWGYVDPYRGACDHDRQKRAGLEERR